jgi:aryl-alcohol dehydrogenase-like predicted oxidoreductase
VGLGTWQTFDVDESAESRARLREVLRRFVALGGRVIDSSPMYGRFVQLNYSLAERDAERRLLPLAQEKGIAILVNRPFAEGARFERVRGRQLPAWAAEAGTTSWAQVFLKWIIGHPAVTCVIPATSNPAHVADNMAAARGPVPDAAMRDTMLRSLGM